MEAPGGDILRYLAAGSRSPAMSGKFINFNRNKRAITLDIKRPAGLAALKRLIAAADVFVSNVRAAGLARAGLDPAALALAQPAADPLRHRRLRRGRALCRPPGL